MIQGKISDVVVFLRSVVSVLCIQNVIPYKNL